MHPTHPSDESSESSLILPGQQPSDAQSLEGLGPVVWLRNPKTGVIHKFAHPQHDDTIARCLKEGYTHSHEGAARAQAVELAKLQGRPLPPWAREAEDEKPVAAAAAHAASAKAR